jgi:hypothetical protein
MADANVLSIVASLVGGGAVGSILTLVANGLKGRVPRVSYRLDYTQIFRNTLGSSSLRTQVTVTDKRTKFTYDNLHVVQISIWNSSSVDFPEFSLGLDLAQGDRVIFVESTTPSRSHIATTSIVAGLQTPQRNADITFKPFNRKNGYLIKLYVVTLKKNVRPGQITLSSSHSVKFVESVSTSETLLGIVTGTIKSSLQIPIGLVVGKQ